MVVFSRLCWILINKDVDLMAIKEFKIRFFKKSPRPPKNKTKTKTKQNKAKQGITSNCLDTKYTQISFKK